MTTEQSSQEYEVPSLQYMDSHIYSEVQDDEIPEGGPYTMKKNPVYNVVTKASKF